MREIQNILEQISSQIADSREGELRDRLVAEDREVTLNAIHGSIEGLRDDVRELTYKLEQIEMRVEDIDTKLEQKESKR